MDQLCKYDYVGPGSWGQDLGPFLHSGGELVSKAERATPRTPGGCVKVEPMPRPVCRMFDRCEGCPYPGHGFICWGPDGGCLRSEMEKICTPKEETRQ